jgi:hypothetical protein
MQLQEPKIYQGERVIPGRVVRKGNRLALEAPGYDPALPVPFGPEIRFTTLFGGGGGDTDAGRYPVRSFSKILLVLIGW